MTASTVPSVASAPTTLVTADIIDQCQRVTFRFIFPGQIMVPSEFQNLEPAKKLPATAPQKGRRLLNSRDLFNIQMPSIVAGLNDDLNFTYARILTHPGKDDREQVVLRIAMKREANDGVEDANYTLGQTKVLAAPLPQFRGWIEAYLNPDPFARGKRRHMLIVDCYVDTRHVGPTDNQIWMGSKPSNLVYSTTEMFEAYQAANKR